MEVMLAVQELLEGLQQLSSSTSPGVCFKGGQDWEEKLGQVSLSQKLSYNVKVIHVCSYRFKVSISALTHGLSLHPPPRTLTLRYPYHEQDYCNMASNHILSRSFPDSFHSIGRNVGIEPQTRADRLLEAADRMRGSRGEVAEGLVRSELIHDFGIRFWSGLA